MLVKIRRKKPLNKKDMTRRNRRRVRDMKEISLTRETNEGGDKNDKTKYKNTT